VGLGRGSCKGVDARRAAPNIGAAGVDSVSAPPVLGIFSQQDRLIAMDGHLGQRQRGAGRIGGAGLGILRGPASLRRGAGSFTVTRRQTTPGTYLADSPNDVASSTAGSIIADIYPVLHIVTVIFSST
jgi:hypothetical protein